MRLHRRLADAPGRSAISAFEQPARRSGAAPRASRAVSSSSAAGGAAAAAPPRRTRSISRRVTAGASRASPAATTGSPRRAVAGGVLEQEAARARAEGVVDVLVEVEGRQHEHRAALTPTADEPPRRLDAVDARHAHVHQDDVGRVRRASATASRAVGRLGDDARCRPRRRGSSGSRADERLVVGDQDADHAGGRVGDAGAHREAAPVARARLHLAPESPTRSRMPSSPWPLPSRGPRRRRRSRRSPRPRSP